MKIITTPIQDFKLEYPLEAFSPLTDILFLDIETTGLLPRHSNIYLIGCIYFEYSTPILKQWVAETYEEESLILDAFLTFSSNYHYLIHFNGNQFDLPFIKERASLFSLKESFLSQKGMDLYKRIVPYKEFLKLPNCKQKTLETFLGIQRDDTFSGKELINLYHDYVSTKENAILDLLLLHNAEDMVGMLKMLPILSYVDLFHKDLIVSKVQANYYTDIDGNLRKELIMFLKLPSALPISISTQFEGCYATLFEQEGKLRVPIYEEELKYFYANYKDYYYLPTEDMAVHKSVATYVDSSHRTNATAASCYTKKKSFYLPQWDVLIVPFYKRDFKSKQLFFELDEETKKNRTLFNAYAKHVLENMI